MGAEVGVLEIQIHDNSAKAASGLGNLASALTRVQKALGNGLKLGNTANQIEKLVTKMQTAIPEESISRLERLAKAVETLNRAGGINLSGIKGLSKEIRENVSEIKSAAEGAVSTKSGTQNDFAERFEEAKKFAQETVEAAERIDAPLVEAGRSIGVAADNAERLRDAVAEISSYARLGSGSTPLRLGAGGVPDENALSTWVDYSKQWQTGWTDGSDFHPGWEIKEEFDEASAAVYRFAQEMDSAIQKATELKTLMSGGSPLLLGAGGVPNENALSTWVDFSQQWQTGWTNGNNYDSLWTMAEGFDEVSAGIYRFATAMDEAIKKTTQFMALASGQPIPLLGAGNAGMELSTWVDQSRQWSPDWTYGQQPRLGSGSPDWIYGSGTVSEAREGFEEVRTTTEEIDANMRSVENSVRETIERAKQMSEAMWQAREATKQTAADAKQERLEKNYPQFRELFMSGEKPWVTQVPQMYGFSPEIIKQCETYAQAVAAAAGKTSSLTGASQEAGSSVQGLKEAVKEGGNASDACNGKLKNLDKELKQKKKDAGEATSAFQQFKDAISRMTAPITGFIGQLARVARYRMLRAIIKQISEGFKEGVENYYYYSEAINNGFSAAMDSAATSLQTFKNSIGAAVAPIIQALIPVLQQAVTWFVSLINYANQFIALLSGKTSWSMAVDTTAKAFEETKKKAGGATKAIKDTDKAVKDLLADFDELNIIQSETGGNGGSGGGGGGGGSGKTATDYTKMFTEVSNFDNGIKSLVENLKDNFGSILNLAAKIGAAVLAWRVSSAFSGIIGQAAGLLGSAIILDVVFRLSKTFTSTFLDTGEPGWLLLSGLTPLVGGFIARRLLTQVGLTGMAAYVIPVSLGLAATATISAVLEDADVSALDAKSIEALILGAIEAGAATGIALNAAGVLTAAGAVAAGAAAALLTFGVAIGLKATTDAARDGVITEETLTADAISALLIGGGLAVVGGIIGLSAGAVAGVAGVGALATFGVLVAVQALLEKDKEEPVVWGSETLTQEEIEEVVGKMFTVHPKVRMSLLKSRIEVSEQSKTNLMAAVRDSLEKVDALKIGLDTTDSLEELKKAVFTNDDSLMNRFKEHAKGQQTLVETTLKFAVLPDENGNNTAQESAQNISNGWSQLEGEMDKLGRDLTKAMDKAYRESLDGTISDETKETIEKLTGMMADISAAISYGKTAASSMSGFKAMAKGLTKATTDEVIAYYAQMKDELIAAEMEALKETADSALALSYAYQYLADHADNDADRQKYSDLAKNYSDEYTKLIDNAADSAKETVDKRLSNDKDVTGFVQGMLDNITDAGWNDLKFNAINSNDLWTSIIGPMISPDGTVQENAVKDMKGMLQVLLKRAFGDENAQSFIDAIDAGMMGWDKLISPEIVKSIAESMGLAKESDEVRNAFVEMIQGIFGEKGYTKETVLPEVYVEQPVVAETVVEQEEPEVSGEGGFDWSNYDFGAGNFEFELTDFHGAGTMEEWEELWDAMFASGTGTDAAANALRERLDEIVEMAFIGTGQGSKILEALKNGDLNYGDVIKESVLQSIEEALGLEYDSPEIQEKWNAILEEIFGGEYAPELEVDPELTGKTNGTQWGVRVEQTASRATGYSGDAGVWAGSQKLNDTWDKTTDAESVQAGVQGGTVQLQTDLQNGMANRKSDIQSGVQAGTGSLLTALNNILAAAQAISRKEFTVNLVPSAGFGRFMGQSSDEYSRVTGDA